MLSELAIDIGNRSESLRLTEEKAKT